MHQKVVMAQRANYEQQPKSFGEQFVSKAKAPNAQPQRRQNKKRNNRQFANTNRQPMSLNVDTANNQLSYSSNDPPMQSQEEKSPQMECEQIPNDQMEPRQQQPSNIPRPFERPVNAADSDPKEAEMVKLRGHFAEALMNGPDVHTPAGQQRIVDNLKIYEGKLLQINDDNLSNGHLEQHTKIEKQHQRKESQSADARVA